MYSLKVLAYSASKKSILVSVSRKAGIFVSLVATGNIKVTDGEELPAIGSVHTLPGITSVSTIQSEAENGVVFDWITMQ